MALLARKKTFRPSGRSIRRQYGNSGHIGLRHQRHWWQGGAWKIYAILAGLVLLGGLYLLWWSSIFQITTVQVEGTQQLAPSDIEAVVREQFTDRRWLVVPQSNLWGFSREQAVATLTSRYVVNSITIKKRPLGRLRVMVDEKTAAVTWVSGEHYYTVDGNGIATRELIVPNIDLVEGSQKNAGPSEALTDRSMIDTTIPLVADESVTAVTVGQKIVEPAVIGFITTLATKLPSDTLHIQSFALPSLTSGEVRVHTTEGFAVYLTIQDDPDRQLTNLNLVLREKVKDRRVQYIDLRFGNKVYIK